MYVTSLYAEGEGSYIEKNNPSWEQIRSVIHALNGYHLSGLSIGKEYEEEKRKYDTKEFMYIAGGGENRSYICNFYSYEDGYGEEDDSELILYDPSKSWKGEEIAIVDVFLNFHPPARCLNIDTVLVAAETYSRFGKLDKSLHWGHYSSKSLNESPQPKIIQVHPN